MAVLAQKREPLRSWELGTIKNSLGILSEDGSKFKPDKFASLTGLGKTELEKITGISRPQFYKKEILIKPSSKILKRIVSVVIAADLAFELFGEDKKETSSWLMAPNAMLFGDSPFEVCMRGEGEKLIQWLNQRLGKITDNLG
jgi:uncharacterized protein (DUF2384 family)